MPARILILCLFLASCSSSRMIETTLYMGQTRPDGSPITDKEWRDFKDNHMSKVFREGSTTITATGTWFDPDKKTLITEPSNVVVKFHKNSPEISRQIDTLALLYKSMFNQQSVLRVDKKAKVVFL
jgi:hypothetical protein